MTCKFILSLLTGINNLLPVGNGQKKSAGQKLIPADNNKQNT
jgi:hypothetical protein